MRALDGIHHCDWRVPVLTQAGLEIHRALFCQPFLYGIAEAPAHLQNQQMYAEKTQTLQYQQHRYSLALLMLKTLQNQDDYVDQGGKQEHPDVYLHEKNFCEDAQVLERL